VFARVSTFEGVDLEAVERTKDAARQREEAIFQAMPGWRGTINLGDRSSGKVVAVSLFDSEDDLKAAEPVFEEEIPRRLGDLMQEWSGRRVSVERFEVLLEQRPSG